ncbi:hypothetical protein SESBI_22909 [Sesbania bispinosa]|nr:hypothetical protein SESBI_22909 [Sesbania bispinosa]
MACLVVVVVWVAIAHRAEPEKPNSNHDRTIRRLRALHGPPLHLRLRSHNSSLF